VGGPCGERNAGLVEGWEDTSISSGTSYHSKATTVVTTATSQTKKHTNVIPEGEQRDMDELVEKYINPFTQRKIISLMLINPAEAYEYIFPPLIRLARAILVVRNYYGSNNRTGSGGGRSNHTFDSSPTQSRGGSRKCNSSRNSPASTIFLSSNFILTWSAVNSCQSSIWAKDHRVPVWCGMLCVPGWHERKFPLYYYFY
jgi:hypothetical protein